MFSSSLWGEITHTVEVALTLHLTSLKHYQPDSHDTTGASSRSRRPHDHRIAPALARKYLWSLHHKGTTFIL